MLVKYKMIKDAITIDVNSSMLEAINRQGPIMACSWLTGPAKMDFTYLNNLFPRCPGNECPRDDLRRRSLSRSPNKASVITFVCPLPSKLSKDTKLFPVMLCG